MINNDVQNDPSSAKVSGVSEFAELIGSGRAFVENHQRWVDSGKIQRCVGAAETSETRSGSWRRIDRQQVKDPAIECVQDMRKLIG